MQMNLLIIIGAIILILSIIIGFFRLYHPFKTLNKANYNEDEYDIIIVGAGLAGLTAAYEANKLTNNSARILLLEASDTYGGNSINDIDGINILLNEKNDNANNIRDSFSLFFNDSNEYGQYTSDTELLTILVNKSHELLDFFIKDLGCNNLRIIKSEGSSFSRTFISNFSNITTGKYLSTSLYNRLKNISSTKILFNSIFTDLIINSEHTVVHGIKYNISTNNITNANTSTIETKSIYSKSVILCTGGYGSDFYTNESILNESLVQLYYFPTFTTKYTRGDGLKIVRNKGGALTHQRFGDIYPTCFVHLKDRFNRHKILCPDKFRELGAILMNKRGKRFCDERGTRRYVGQNILKNCDIVTDPKIIKQYEGFLIINEAIKKQYGNDINTFIDKGFFIKYKSFEDFAKDMNISNYIENIRKSIRSYNQISETKSDEYNKNNFQNKFKMKSTIYVAIITPCTFHTFGGVQITDECEILNTKDRIIYGLYAAGEVIGGIHGSLAMQGNILTQAAVFGREAAKAAVKYIKE